MKSHSEERPHKCGICERGFKTLASLQNHVNTHTGVRPHGCKYCDAAFTTSGKLNDKEKTKKFKNKPKEIYLNEIFFRGTRSACSVSSHS